MEKNIKIEKVYDYNINTIWKALTNREIINEWFMKNDFEPTMGHQFTFTDKPKFGWDGIVYCKVLEIDEPYTLSYSWRGNNKKGTIETVVKFSLKEDNNKTILSLEHTGFKGVNGVFVSTILNAGWNKILSKKLDNIIEKIDSSK